MQLLLNPATIENGGTGSSKNNKTLKKKVNFDDTKKPSNSHTSSNLLTMEKDKQNIQKIDKNLLSSLTNEADEDENLNKLYSNYNDLYNETNINNIRNTIEESINKKKTSLQDDSDDNEISGITNYNKSNYNESYKMNYDNFNNNQNNIINNNNKLLDKIDYIIHLLEEQHNEKTSNITEELILYLFLGIFIIYVLDSFSRISKYKR